MQIVLLIIVVLSGPTFNFMYAGVPLKQKDRPLKWKPSSREGPNPMATRGQLGA